MKTNKIESDEEQKEFFDNFAEGKIHKFVNGQRVDPALTGEEARLYFQTYFPGYIDRIDRSQQYLIEGKPQLVNIHRARFINKVLSKPLLEDQQDIDNLQFLTKLYCVALDIFRTDSELRKTCGLTEEDLEELERQYSEPGKSSNIKIS